MADVQKTKIPSPSQVHHMHNGNNVSSLEGCYEIKCDNRWQWFIKIFLWGGISFLSMLVILFFLSLHFQVRLPLIWHILWSLDSENKSLLATPPAGPNLKKSPQVVRAWKKAPSTQAAFKTNEGVKHCPAFWTDDIVGYSVLLKKKLFFEAERNFNLIAWLLCRLLSYSISQHHKWQLWQEAESIYNIFAVLESVPPPQSRDLETQRPASHRMPQTSCVHM